MSRRVVVIDSGHVTIADAIGARLSLDNLYAHIDLASASDAERDRVIDEALRRLDMRLIVGDLGEDRRDLISYGSTGDTIETFDGPIPTRGLSPESVARLRKAAEKRARRRQRVQRDGRHDGTG